MCFCYCCCYISMCELGSPHHISIYIDIDVYYFLVPIFIILHIPLQLLVQLHIIYTFGFVLNRLVIVIIYELLLTFRPWGKFWETFPFYDKSKRFGFSY